MRRLRQLAAVALAVAAVLALAGAEAAPGACAADSPAARAAARRRTAGLFHHAYASYKQHALPRDELRPLSCGGVDSFGGVRVTLIDSLDALAVFGEWEEFVWAVREVEASVGSFDVPANVSVFETTIRVLGALVSAHGLMTDAAPAAGWAPAELYPEYDGGLLRLAVDVADRLMPAFDTPTGIPFGSVGLRVGVHPGETVIASTAAAGGLLLEMGTLSAMSGDKRYYEAAFRSLQALHERVAWTGLVGNHIDTSTGKWTAHEAGIGALIDSYYEYMVKGYALFGDQRLMDMFWEAYGAVKRHVQKLPWYLPVDMFSGQISSFGHCSLGAFWPGMQVMVGDIDEAIETTRAHYSVWRRYGCIPEQYHVYAQRPVEGAVNYPLRPELLESVFYLHWATNDSSWIGVALSMMHSLETLTRVPCGFARIRHVATHVQEDVQDSFLISETLKYMYLMFDDTHWLRSGRWVFSTEAHPMLITGKPVPGVPTARNPPKDSSASASASPTAKWHDRSARRSKRKCPRRSNIASRSSCGFGMPGTDHPTLDLAKLRTEPIDEDVRETLRERIASSNIPVQLGDVVFGAMSTYRVVRIDNGEVMLSKLNSAEAAAARALQHNRAMTKVYERVFQRTVAEDPGSYVDKSPSISPPQLLTAKREWESLLMCDAETGEGHDRAGAPNAASPAAPGGQEGT